MLTKIGLLRPSTRGGIIVSYDNIISSPMKAVNNGMFAIKCKSSCERYFRCTVWIWPTRE